MPTPYEIGRIHEYKAKEILESWFGCNVIRSAGSHTPIDLIAGNGIQVFAVQCKTEGSFEGFDWNMLRRWAESFQAVPTVFVFMQGGIVRIYFDGIQWDKATEQALTLQ